VLLNKPQTKMIADAVLLKLGSRTGKCNLVAKSGALWFSFQDNIYRVSVRRVGTGVREGTIPRCVCQGRTGSQTELERVSSSSMVPKPPCQMAQKGTAKKNRLHDDR
jgi:hypothetical protein